MLYNIYLVLIQTFYEKKKNTPIYLNREGVVRNTSLGFQFYSDCAQWLYINFNTCFHLKHIKKKHPIFFKVKMFLEVFLLYL